MMEIKKGSSVKLEYEGKLEDGTVFDSSEKHSRPLSFIVGTGQVIPGLDNALIGMKKGQEKEIKIKSSEAYGKRREDLIKKSPRAKLPPEAKKGGVLVVKLPNGLQVPGKVVKIDKTEATIDFNHPLCGKDLLFKIKVVDVG